jgi:TPR repeat protein
MAERGREDFIGFCSKGDRAMKKSLSWKASLLLLPWLAGGSAWASDLYVEGYDRAIAGDYGSAYAQWMPLALNGDGRAQFNLALMYHSGLHVDFDEHKAVYWYQAAAENGIREAQEYMYVGYKEGWFGLPKAERQAAYWADKLAHNPS